MSDQNIVREWLRSLDLENYYEAFVDNGYDDLEMCKQIGDPDLDAIGVRSAKDRQTVKGAVRTLLEKGGTSVYISLEECGRMGQSQEDEDESRRKSSVSADNKGSPSRLSSSRFRSSSSTCIDRDTREKFHGDGSKKKIGLGKFFRHLSNVKTSPRHGSKPGLPKSNSQAERTPMDDVLGGGNDAEEEEQMKIVKMVQDSYISTRTQPPQSVIAELGRAMSWSAQSTKKKEKNYMSLFFNENSSSNSKSITDPAKESNQSQTNITTSTPIVTSNSAATTPPAPSTEPCGGNCGNIMCSLTPACIEDVFKDEEEPVRTNPPRTSPQRASPPRNSQQKTSPPRTSPQRTSPPRTSPQRTSPPRTSPQRTSPTEDETARLDEEEDESLRRRTKSEGCYSTAYRAKGSRRSSPSLDSSRELLSPSVPEDSDDLDTVGCDSTTRLSHSTSSTSTWSGRVRDLKREVRHRIGRLRKTPSDTATKQVSETNPALDTLNSTESISNNTNSPTDDSSSKSNHGFVCSGEEDSFVESGRVLGRARALVDCTPSPYDKDGLAFKKGDLIDILAKSSSGYWVGRLRNQIGHFKFINVEEIQNGDRKSSSQRRLSSFEQKETTLEDLLDHLGLEVYMNVLVLNGYHNLDSLKGIEEQELIALGIVNADHRKKLLNAIGHFDDINFDTIVSSGSLDGNQSTLHQQQSNNTVFSSRLFSSPRKRSDSCSSTMPESYMPHVPFSPKVTNLDCYPDVPYKCNEINNLDYGMPSMQRSNGIELLDDDRQRDILNIPLSRPPEKLYFYSDMQSNQKIHYSYGRGISAYSEQLYFARAGLVIDSPAKDHFLSQMNYIEKLSDFNHLNGAIYPNSGAYITKEEKYLMESSRRKLKDQMRTFGKGQQDSAQDFNGYLEPSFQNAAEPIQKNGKSMTLPRKMKGCPTNDLLILQSSETGAYKADRKGKKSRRRKEDPHALMQCSAQPFTLDDFVAKKLQDERIDLCLEPYTDKTGFCGIPPALVQRYADELQQDIFDIAEALDRERVRGLQIRGRPAVPNDFLADSCCEPVVEANYNSLSDWLISLGLPIYENLLHRKGCTDLYHIAALKDKDLIHYGIENPKHIRLLTTAIEALHIHIEHCQYIA